MPKIPAPKVDCAKNPSQVPKSPQKTGLVALLPIFRQWRVCLFVFMSFFIGLEYGQLFTTTAIFYKQLGASQFLLHLSLTSFIFVLFLTMFFSGKISSKIGPEFSLATSLFLFGLRAMICWQTKDARMSLVTEPMFALAFGLFVPNAVGYMKSKAIPGAEASAQTLICGVYEGLGL